MKPSLSSETGTVVTRCAAILRKAQGLLVITGAGISAESGMPTYRGCGGLYEKNPEYTSTLSAAGLAHEPEKIWKHIDDLRVRAAAAQPNPAHRILAQWERERRFCRFLIATQNIDGLHQKAGSNRVTELHGSVWQMACPLSVDFAEDDQLSRDANDLISLENREEVLCRWSQENNHTVWEDREVPFASIPPYRDTDVRPNVVFFNENYGNRLLWVEDFIRRTPDAVLVIGCSGGVSIVDRLLRNCRDANPGCAIINVNTYEDFINLSHLHIPMPATAAMEALHAMLETAPGHETAIDTETHPLQDPSSKTGSMNEQSQVKRWAGD
jgi:NAD-dependent SIR2 family protein deacetylase